MASDFSKIDRRGVSALGIRIWGIVIPPLILLAIIFSVAQMTSQINTIKNQYVLESRLLLGLISKALYEHPIDFSRLEARQALAQKVEKQFKVPIEFYSLDSSLTPNENTLKFDDPAQSWAPSDESQIWIDKKLKQMIAIIPIASEQKDQSEWHAVVRIPLFEFSRVVVEGREMLICIFLFIAGAGLLMSYLLSKAIVNPIRQLSDATHEIIRGNLGQHVKIRTGDEIERLAEAFNHMSDSMKLMKQKAEDSNPLTNLPGNHAIFFDLSKRIYERQKFVLFHCDLDRFKVFNDDYGLAKGDIVITRTAKILRDAIKSDGTDDDFIGHQGGDDFILVTRPHRALQVAQYVIKHFESEILPEVYPEDIVKQGYTMGIDRRLLARTGEETMTQFPLVAISLAGVSNAKQEFVDYADCMAKAVKIKKEVKQNLKSSFIIRE